MRTASAAPGETLARRILRDDEFVQAREVLVDQLGRFLAGLHAVAPAEVPGAAEVDELARYWTSYGAVPDRSATFEEAHAWLEANRPPRPATTLVHGDLRMGNVIVDAEGLAAVIDWELEWDLIELLAPDAWTAARAAALPAERTDEPDLFGRPTARELLEAVRGFLTEDVMPGTTGRLSYHARVAANMLAIVERELAQDTPERTGDDWTSLAMAVRDKLAVANPRHLAG